MRWQDILKSRFGRVRTLVEEIKPFFVQNFRGMVTKTSNELKKVKKQIKEIKDNVKQNNLGEIDLYYNKIVIFQTKEDYENSKKENYYHDNYSYSDTDIKYNAKRNRKLERQLRKLIDKENNLSRRLNTYKSVDIKLETFNDPMLLTDYADSKYGIDLTHPETLKLFMETMRLQGLEPIEGAVKLAGSVGQKTDERKIDLNMLKETVNMLVNMNKEIPLKEDVAEEMGININQNWDYRADEAYKQAIQLLRQRGKI
tara:strand:- start:869 stop:1636 length:768 start_codon:yes stop_codon:yes gene_type:complete